MGDFLLSSSYPSLFMACVVACILAPGYFRSRDKAQMQETLRTALEKGVSLPPELIAALQSNLSTAVVPTREGDLRRGIVLIACGIGFALLGYGLWYGLMSVSDEGAYITGGSVAGFGAIPGLIGIAYLVLWAMKPKTPKS